MPIRTINSVVAEPEGQGWMQRNWRPSLMFVFMAILVYQYLVGPILTAFGLGVPPVYLPPEFWTLMTIGVSGYIGLRSVEKSAPAIVEAVKNSYAPDINVDYAEMVKQTNERMGVKDRPTELPRAELPKMTPSELDKLKEMLRD
jgi:hypothetical protein